MLTYNLPGFTKVCSGKVREVFELDDQLLIVSTDRISAYDEILNAAIPYKGQVLNQLSGFWFETLNFVPNHLISYRVEQFPEILSPFKAELYGRSMLVKKTFPLPIECVARGYLAGSAWKEYEASGTVAGEVLPRGLQLAEKLACAIFTPATKAKTGHDENISWNQCRSIVGDDIAWQIRKCTLELYETAHAIISEKGLILADTKFEFGLLDGNVVLIDECITPDSSRLWSKDTYKKGKNPASFDKQFVRDFITTNNNYDLPEDIICKTSEKYIEAYEKLTGRNLHLKS
jgi:phosphoribosylaminoimidazole-succinocarboxamide synthase